MAVVEHVVSPGLGRAGRAAVGGSLSRAGRGAGPWDDRRPMSGWYHDTIVEPGRSGVLWVLVAFVVTFVATRLVTHHIRAAASRGPATRPGRRALIGDIHVGGVHLHHQVPGILMVLASALLEFAYQPASPWLDVLGATFGAGAALTLDEFALWLYLDDVYWTREGRRSIDAVVVGACICGILLVGTTPFGLDEEEVNTVGLGAAAATIGANGALAVVTFLKGKLLTGAVGLLVPVVGLVGAIRLAKPTSPWARWRYRSRPTRLERAERRARRDRRRLERMRDALGGA